MIHEFKNLWEVDTPQGYGRAILLESKDNDYYWTVVLADSLAVVTFPQNKIRICRHYSLNLKFSEEEMTVVLK